MQNKSKEFFKNYYYVFFYFVVSLFLFRNLLSRGYLLTLDMIFTPQMLPGEPLNIFSIIKYVLFVVAQIIPADILQKAILLGIFTICGSTFYYLSFRIFKNKTASLLSGIFYTINPFVFERIIAGHWQFLIGYALTPIFILLLNEIQISKFKERFLTWTITFWIIVSTISQHHFLLFGLIFTTFTLFYVAKKIVQKKEFTISPINTASTFVICLWAILLTLYSATLPFHSEELIYFASSSGKNIGLIPNLLSLNGIWAEGTVIPNIYNEFSKGIIILWAIILLSLTSAIAIPVLNFTKLKKILQIQNNHISLILPILATGFVGVTLSIGANGIIGEIYQFLMDDLPILRGMREPHKFLSLYALTISLGLAVSINLVHNFIKAPNNALGSKINIIFSIFMSLSIVISVFPILNNFSNELTPVEFPKSYFEVEKILNTQSDARILILPDNAYFDVSWNNKRIANPTKYFFDNEFVNSDSKQIFTKKECDIDSIVLDSDEENNQNYRLCFDYSDNTDVFAKTLKLLDIDTILIVNYSQNKSKTDLLITNSSFNTIYISDEISLFELKSQN